MNKSHGILIGILVLLVVVAGVAFWSLSDFNQINSFDECVAAGNPVAESYPRQCRTSDGKVFVEDVSFGENSPSLVSYFQQELFDKSVEGLGGNMPIEGFNPDLYIGALPNFMKEDFKDVEAINGIWRYDSVSDMLEFEMASGQLITSADGTINEEGMPTLLMNLEKRFNFDVQSQEDVDELIEMLR